MDLHKCKQSASITVFLSTIFLCNGFIYAEDNSGNQTGYSNEKNETILNVIHSDRIRAIMRRLNMLAYEREYTDLELEQLFREQIELLITAADELRNSAEILPNITSSELDETDVTAFRALANQLYRETLNLQEQIHASHFQEIRTSYQRLRETCNACHQLFRDR